MLTGLQLTARSGCAQFVDLPSGSADTRILAYEVRQFGAGQAASRCRERTGFSVIWK